MDVDMPGGGSFLLLLTIHDPSRISSTFLPTIYTKFLTDPIPTLKIELHGLYARKYNKGGFL